MKDAIDRLKAMKLEVDADAARHHGEYEGGVGDGLQLALEALGVAEPEPRLDTLRASLGTGKGAAT